MQDMARISMPKLITDTFEAAKYKARLRLGYKTRPVCSDCGTSTIVVKIDRGFWFDKNTSGTSDFGKKIEGKLRREHIGYWCPTCRYFFYKEEKKEGGQNDPA
jgi:transposase-like protein